MNYKMNFNDFLKGESVFSHREESELAQAKKKIKDYFLQNIFEINLSKREREVYYLKNKKYLTHTEIAKKLGITRKTSRNTLSNANRKILKISKKFQEYKNE
ncbi:sigma factor-like helix-turn-helix DNA-binding protein [uncultured Fusobacterium sp.]|uniref:sigma factor-like helix-turn-helix DNA-binding protein n=1 Tax=uncultured Fusobacterium sp. TaxID=159267 RepID=UPI002596BA97|nr:sigma factor-like helix-turn-helix DNA-binding protein [uncultured Fusobacterium sp.]